ATEIGIEVSGDLLVEDLGDGSQQTNGSDHHACRAVAALERLGLEKGLLDRMKPATLRQSLDRRHTFAGDGFDGVDARPPHLPVHQDGARAALTLAAAILRA